MVQFNFVLYFIIIILFITGAKTKMVPSLTFCACMFYYYYYIFCIISFIILGGIYVLFCQNTLIIYLFLKHNGIFCFVFRCMCMKYSVLITSGWRETLTKVNTQFLPISSVLCVKNEENLNELSLLLQNKLQFLPGFKQRSKVGARLPEV